MDATIYIYIYIYSGQNVTLLVSLSRRWGLMHFSRCIFPDINERPDFGSKSSDSETPVQDLWVMLDTTPKTFLPASQDLLHNLFHLPNCLIMTRFSLSLGNKQKSQGARSVCREADELSWCPSWSNSLWQGWSSCGLVHCPGGNATDLKCAGLLQQKLFMNSLKTTT